MNKPSYSLFPLLSACLAILMGSGCQTVSDDVSDQTVAPLPEPEWIVYEAATAQPIEWESFVKTLAEADIVVVGERHNHVLGHELEAKISRAMLEKHPSGAIAMEMFERNEQAIVDLYLDDEIQQKTLVKITGSANWGGGENTWSDWYQPIVDAVKAHRNVGAVLIAANSPKPYVTLARMDGFSPLKLLQENGISSFTIPDLSIDDSAYKGRFLGFMVPKQSTPTEKPEKRESNKKSAQKGKHDKQGTKHSPTHGHSLEIDPEAFFQAQQVWDASMADSVVKAATMHPHVTLFIGDFHIANNGGTLVRIQAHAPEKVTRSVSIQPVEDIHSFDSKAHQLHADYLIYTNQ